MLPRRPVLGSTLLLALLVSAACSDHSEVTAAPPPAAPVASFAAVRPGPLVPVSLGGEAVSVWPYTDSDLDGIPSDPINLIFQGAGDAMNVRAALMSLDGNRAGPLAAFTCTWTDAIGSDQASYTATTDWIGSAIQLECGAYNPFRFHVRLFPAGGFTLANAHADVLIRGTEQHQVLTWEFAELLVAYDLGRSGLLAAAPAQTGPINAAPTFREIPPIIYNGLPAQLRALTGGPLDGDVTSGVGIPTDGSATVLTLLPAPPSGGSSQTVELTFGQVIPKPFCDSGGEFIRVDGPVTIRQDVRVSASGSLQRQTVGHAELVVRSIDLGTGALGSPADARVGTRYTAQLNGHSHLVVNTNQQQLSTEGPPQQFFQQLRAGSGPAQYRASERCR